MRGLAHWSVCPLPGWVVFAGLWGGGLLGREKKNRGLSDSLEQGFWAESRNDLANSDSLSLWEAGS